MVTGTYSFAQLEENDFDWFLEIRNISRLSLHNPTLFSREESKPWFQENKDSFRKILFENNQIGYFRIGDKQERFNRNLLLIGADLHPSYRGMGHAFNAYEACLPILKKEFGVEGFVLSVLPNNFVAQNLYRKLGFKTSNLSYELSAESRTLIVTDIEMVLFPGSELTDFIDLLKKRSW